MDSYAERVIKALGGTTEVARLTKTPISTIHSRKKSGFSEGQLDHLKLAAQAEGYVMDWETGVLIRKDPPLPFLNLIRGTDHRNPAEAQA